MSLAITADNFDELHREFAATVRRKIAKAGVPEDDLDDVCQACWIHIWRYRAGYDAAYPLSTFIAMAADHAAARYWRDRNSKSEFVPIAEDVDHDEDDSGTRRTAPFVPRTESAERSAIVRDILYRLPHAYQRCLELREAGYEQSEVGQLLHFDAPGPLEERAKARFRSLWNTGQLRRSHPRKGKHASHCKHGHDLRIADNVYSPPGRPGNVKCAVCRRAYKKVSE